MLKDGVLQSIRMQSIINKIRIVLKEGILLFYVAESNFGMDLLTLLVVLSSAAFQVLAFA